VKFQTRVTNVNALKKTELGNAALSASCEKQNLYEILLYSYIPFEQRQFFWLCKKNCLPLKKLPLLAGYFDSFKAMETRSIARQTLWYLATLGSFQWSFFGHFIEFSCQWQVAFDPRLYLQGVRCMDETENKLQYSTTHWMIMTHYSWKRYTCGSVKRVTYLKCSWNNFCGINSELDGTWIIGWWIDRILSYRPLAAQLNNRFQHPRAKQFVLPSILGFLTPPC